MPPPSQAASGALRAALILAAAVAVSAGTVGHGFVFDDHLLLGGSGPVIRGEALLSSAFTYRYWGAADEASPNELYRPITIVSLALNARLLGQEPAGMHAANVLLHALDALLLYALASWLFGRPILGLLAALIFAVHPIASEAVAAVAGRADLLSTFFLLSASLLGLAACRLRGAWILVGGLGVAAATFMGALSKESAFAAPLVLAAVLGSDARRHLGSDRDRREYLVTAATMAGIQAFALLMAVILRVQILDYLYRTEPPSDPSSAYLAFVNNPLQFAGPLGRVLTALRVAVMGAGLLVFPLNLSADYSYNQIPVTQGAPSALDLGAALFAAIYLGLLLFSARRFPVVMFALSWSALTYLIVSNLLFPIGTIFGERLLYTPSIGYAVLLAAGFTKLAAGGPTRKVAAAALAVALLGLYGGRFVARCADWADDDRLFKAAVAASPDSAKAHSNYGFTLQRAGRHEEAIAEYRRALQIAPGLTGSRISLARILLQLERPGEAAAEFEAVIERDDGISVAWSGLGLAQEALDQREAAEASFRKALELSRGGNREAIGGLARVLTGSGREEEAVEMLARVVKALPGGVELRDDLAQAHYKLGIRRLKEGKQEEFLAAMRSAVETDPDHGPAHYNLALDALQRGETAAARDHALAGLRAGYRFPPGFLEACGLSATVPPAISPP